MLIRQSCLRWAQVAAGLALVALLSACLVGGNDESGATGSLRIGHDTTGSIALSTNPAHYTTFIGRDASGARVYGPVTQPFAAEHALAEVPARVTLLEMEHRHAAGHLVATASIVLQAFAHPTGLLNAVAAAPASQVQVELVNDTDKPDNKIFVLFDSPKDAAADAVQGNNLVLLANSGSTAVSGTGVSLASLTPTGSMVSAHTGNTRKVYGFTVKNVDSGRLSFSYDAPVAITKGAAPTADTGVRYDKMEITFKDGAGGGNLTAIDFHAIPLQVEVTHAGESQPDPLQTKTVHATLPTILQALQSMATQGGTDIAPALMNTQGGRFAFTPGVTTDFSTFARILAPNTLAAANGSNGSPAPYPSFAAYLKSLVGKSYVINGKQYKGYKYTATFQSDGAGGYLIHCVGAVNQAQDMPANSNAPQLPGPADAAAVTVLLPKDKLDFYIYATVVNSSSYRIAGYPFEAGTRSLPSGTVTYTAQDKVNAANASAYGALVGDLQAALNFGYLGGRFDVSANGAGGVQDISTYYASVMLPYAYPYGGARNPNDGFYNPYAALFYYLSDAYGHPYSDRLAAASPLYSLRPGDTVRITVLNDGRLDTPLASVSVRGTDSLSITWPTVRGATGYSVETRPALAQPVCGSGIVAANGVQTCTLSGLSPGTSYLVSVTATRTAGNGVATRSGVLPIQGSTMGTAPARGTGTMQAQFGVNLPDAPVIPGMQAFVDGRLASGGSSLAPISAAAGENRFGLEIRDAGGNVAYAGNYFVTFTPSTAAGTPSFNIGPMQLDYGLTPLAPAGPPGTPPYPNFGGLVIGTPFTPKPYYQYWPTVFAPKK